MKRMIISAIFCMTAAILFSCGGGSGGSSGGYSAWTRLSGVSGCETFSTDIAVDSSGNSYVTGNTAGDLDGQTLSGGSAGYLIKYNSSGVKQWTRLICGTGVMEGNAIAVDSKGSIYVTGRTEGNFDGLTLNGSCGAFVVKYDAAGNRLWSSILGVSGAFTSGYGVAADSSGNCYVTGITRGNLNGQTLTGAQDLFVAKYDAEGNEKWTSLLGGSTTYTESSDIAVDSSGGIYVTGYVNGNLDNQTLTGSNAAFVAKYVTSGTGTQTGTKVWTTLLDGAASTSTFGFGIAVDSAGNIYVTGYTTDSLDGSLAGITDSFVISCSSSGTKQWTKQLGVSGVETGGNDIAADSSGNIYITGYTYGSLDGQTLTGTTDAFVTKYKVSSLSADKQWTKQLGVAGASIPGYSIAVDSSGKSYVAGYTNGALDGQTLTGSLDAFVTTKFNE